MALLSISIFIIHFYSFRILCCNTKNSHNIPPLSFTQLENCPIKVIRIIENMIRRIKRRLLLRKRNHYEIKLADSLPKRLITLSPGGFKGFYSLGIVLYIQENYDLTNYIFSGVSAGSYNALVLAYKGNAKKLLDEIMIPEIINHSSLQKIQQEIKKMVVSRCSVNDFHLEKLHISVAHIHKITNPLSLFTQKINKVVFSHFTSLEDTLDACFASSNIPFITGDMYSFYRNKYCIDGGFLNDPYLEHTEKPVLHITSSLWKKTLSVPAWWDCLNIKYYFSIFSKKEDNLWEMFRQGYEDSWQNRAVLDEIFCSTCR